MNGRRKPTKHLPSSPPEKSCPAVADQSRGRACGSNGHAKASGRVKSSRTRNRAKGSPRLQLRQQFSSRGREKKDTCACACIIRGEQRRGDKGFLFQGDLLSLSATHTQTSPCEYPRAHTHTHGLPFKRQSRQRLGWDRQVTLRERNMGGGGRRCSSSISVPPFVSRRKWTSVVDP